MNEKTMGHIAYEAFHGAAAPHDMPPLEWHEVRVSDRAAWHAAATAVLAQPHEGTIVGGPIEMRDYDYVTLAQPHRLEYPADALGFPTKLPAGTKLRMVKPAPRALGITYETGAACKAGDWPQYFVIPGTETPLDGPEADARTNDLVAEPRKEPTK